MKNTNTIVLVVMSAILLASIISLIRNNKIEYIDDEDQYTSRTTSRTTNATNTNNSFSASVIVIIIVLCGIYLTMTRTKNSDVTKNTKQQQIKTSPNNTQLKRFADNDDSIKKQFNNLLQQENPQEISTINKQIEKYKTLVEKNLALQLEIEALKKQKKNITIANSSQLQIIKNSTSERQSQLMNKINQLQQQLKRKQKQQQKQQFGTDKKLFQKISKLEQQLKQKGLRQTQRQKKIVELANMLQLANKKLTQNQRSPTQVQTQQRLRERIKELQEDLAKNSSESNVQQLKRNQQILKKTIESLRSDIKSIKPIQGGKQSGEQILDKLKQWEKLKRASEKKSKRYNEHVQTRKAVDFLEKIEKNTNSGFIEDKFGRKEIITGLQELYKNEIFQYEEKEKLYKNYLTNFYLYSILINYLNNGNFTESAANKDDLLNPQHIEDYVNNHINGLDSIPNETVIQERFTYLVELKDIAKLDTTSDDLPKKLTRYIRSGITINSDDKKQVSNKNEILASFVNNNNIVCDGIFVTPDAKLILMVQLCLLRKNYPKIYNEINIKTFLKESLINICLSLYGNQSISNKKEDIRNIVLEMERQNLRDKIKYDVNQDLDEDLFKSVKSKLMLIEYELNSDKTKRPSNYKQVIQRGIEKEIQKELIDPFEKGFIGFAIQSKAKVNKPVKPANNQQILKLYKDNLLYKNVISKQQLQTINNIEQLKKIETNMKEIEFLKQYIEPYIDPTRLKIPDIAIPSDYIEEYIQSNTQKQKKQVLADHYNKIFNNVSQNKNAIIDLMKIKNVQPIIIQNVNLGLIQKIQNKAQRKKLELTPRFLEKMLSQTILKNQVFEQSEKGISLKPSSNKEFLTNYINNIADEKGLDKSISILNLLTNLAIKKTKALAKVGAPSDAQLLRKGQQIVQRIIKREKQNIAKMNQTQSQQSESQTEIIPISKHPELTKLVKVYDMMGEYGESAVRRNLMTTPVKGYRDDQVLDMIKTKAKFRKLQDGSYKLITKGESQTEIIPISKHPELTKLVKVYDMMGEYGESAVRRNLMTTPVKGYTTEQVIDMIKTQAKFRKLQDGSYELISPQGSKNRQRQNKQSGGGKQTNQGKSGGGGGLSFLNEISTRKSGGGGGSGGLSFLNEISTLKPVDKQVKSGVGGGSGGLSFLNEISAGKD